MQLQKANALAPASREITPHSSAAAAIQQIQAAVIIAQQKQRIEGNARTRIMESLERFEFADEALYRFPRGNTEVDGASVYLARELSKFWGNMRSGWVQTADIEANDHEPGMAAIEGFAWDLETNSYKAYQQTVRKLIFRKGKGWIEPDERELRELVARIGSMLERNAILNLLPVDLIEASKDKARQTIAQGAKKSELITKTVKAFGEIGITPAMLEKKLGHGLEKISGEELTDLRGIFKSIRDNQSTWADYVPEESAQPDAKVQPAAAAPPANPTPPPARSVSEPPDNGTLASDEPAGPGLTFADFNTDELADLQTWAWHGMRLNRAKLQKWLADYHKSPAEALVEVREAADAAQTRG